MRCHAFWLANVLVDEMSRFLAVHVIGLLVFATVFDSASAFNGDLNQWNVASVTTIHYSKSIAIV
jgi:hypothetical protein